MRSPVAPILFRGEAKALLWSGSWDPLPSHPRLPPCSSFSLTVVLLSEQDGLLQSWNLCSICSLARKALPENSLALPAPPSPSPTLFLCHLLRGAFPHDYFENANFSSPSLLPPCPWFRTSKTSLIQQAPNQFFSAFSPIHLAHCH